MGTRNTDVCLLTGLPVNFVSTKDIAGYEYYLKIEEEEYYFNISELFNSDNSKVVQSQSHVIKGLIFNGLWPKRLNIINDLEILETINNYRYPVLPQQKLDNLFEFLFNLQTKDGEKVDFYGFWEDEHMSNKLFFKDNEECNFYLTTLAEKDLINANFFPTEESYNALGDFSITFQGLEYFLQLTNEWVRSKNCFIAMSFGNEMIQIRNSIKNAIVKCGYSPILIDEVHADSEKTINDEIIAQLKKSKFCIADFTEQRDGVYFESGFALGPGLKVIYTCQEEHFKQSHFDTNHFPHIIYKTPQELEEKLINKIEAWIKD